ncbi:MAG: nuclear transport factor 2 family protein [Nocardioidaceae bacterium]
MAPSTDLIDLYFEADRRQDVDAVVGLFTPAGVVIDDGTTHRGRPAIRDWRDRATSAYEYTTTQIERLPAGDSGTVVTARLDGNFPGGTVDLRYVFDVADALITKLTIAPTETSPGSSDGAALAAPGEPQ